MTAKDLKADRLLKQLWRRSKTYYRKNWQASPNQRMASARLMINLNFNSLRLMTTLVLLRTISKTQVKQSSLQL